MNTLPSPPLYGTGARDQHAGEAPPQVHHVEAIAAEGEGSLPPDRAAGPAARVAIELYHPESWHTIAITSFEIKISL